MTTVAAKTTRQLEQAGKIRSYSRGAFLNQLNSPATCVYYVVRGQIEIIDPGTTGARRILRPTNTFESFEMQTSVMQTNAAGQTCWSGYVRVVDDDTRIILLTIAQVTQLFLKKSRICESQAAHIRELSLKRISHATGFAADEEITDSVDEDGTPRRDTWVGLG